jgi:hypothetical protein
MRLLRRSSGCLGFLRLLQAWLLRCVDRSGRPACAAVPDRDAFDEVAGHVVCPYQLRQRLAARWFAYR